MNKDSMKALFKLWLYNPWYVMQCLLLAWMLGAVLSLGLLFILKMISENIPMSSNMMFLITIGFIHILFIGFLCTAYKGDTYYGNVFDDYESEFRYETQCKKEQRKKENEKKLINEQNAKKLETKLEIENEIKRLSNYLENIKKYKKESAFKTEIKYTEELIEIYRKMLNV